MPNIIVHSGQIFTNIMIKSQTVLKGLEWIRKDGFGKRSIYRVILPIFTLIQSKISGHLKIVQIFLLRIHILVMYWQINYREKYGHLN